ncbi:hypothetical protein [Roseomonas sp. 18066]|uniref:hypothetical protein n=1 Tax=Roseomonas sp. 18066 TaxID=2681412 RepID=UPI00135BA030|nr:hypothetical protein [Roseomonas sp. 18066]
MIATRSTALMAVIALPALLAACAKPTTGPAAVSSRLPIYAADMMGASSLCTVPDAPKLTDAQATEVPMVIGNDGGFCGLRVAKPGPEPFDAGLLTARAANGRVRVQSVGDYTRIDYIADAGFVGTDSFAVRLLPGSTSVKVNVTVQGVAAPAAAATPAAVTPRVSAPPATSSTSTRSTTTTPARATTTPARRSTTPAR